MCLVALLCPTLWIMEWVAISFSRGSSQPRDRTHVSCVSCIADRSFTHWSTRGALLKNKVYLFIDMHIPIYFLLFFSIVVYSKILKIVLCAIHRPLFIHSVCKSLHLLVPTPRPTRLCLFSHLASTRLSSMSVCLFPSLTWVHVSHLLDSAS